jgi:nucleoid DNA-binding protein
MTSLTKRDLVIRISEETGIPQEDVLMIVDGLFATIRGGLSLGMHVELRDFGVFEVKVRKPRIGRNPNAPETDVRIPARAVVKFTPGKEMRLKVLKLTPVEALPDTLPKSVP